MLEIRNLYAYYGNIEALSGVTCHVKQGEIVALIGANGAGKTTLLNSVCGLVYARGKVTFEGNAITQLAPEAVVARGISQAPEGRQIFAPLTVLENLELGAYLRYRQRQREAVSQDLQRIYELFPRLWERRQQTAGTLSGGEQQMLAIGRALMARPRLLLLDEPSLGLAPVIVDAIMETVIKLRETGVTILMVEQNARTALSIADRGYVLETGRIILSAPARELLNDRQVTRAYLGKDYKEFTEGR
ncbi:MAG: ABC transporter ATP-binding protein [Deltaproteobacteria bacterium]|nr:ABC transporter ATP-binding protein [Deltaproteobacteria bacterium]